MRIEELITESQVTDEGVLGSIASGIGTGVGAVAKGLGAVSGAFKGAKDQYQKGQALGRAHVGGHMPAQPKDTSVRDQEFARLTGKGGAAPAAGGAQGGDPQALRAQAADLTKQADALEKEQQAAQKQAAAAQPAAPLETPPATQPGIGQASGGNNAASTNTAPADTSAPAQPAAAPAPTGTAMPTKPYQVPGAGTNPNPTKDAAPAAGAAPMQVQQGGKNPALDARRAALAQSKADTAAGKGVTGAIKTGTMGESLEEGFYSNFLGQVL
jgi:hypothetical protein